MNLDDTKTEKAGDEGVEEEDVDEGEGLQGGGKGGRADGRDIEVEIHDVDGQIARMRIAAKRDIVVRIPKSILV